MDASASGGLMASSDGETAVPIQRLGAGSAVVRDVVRLSRPAVITDDGVPVAAIVDAATYEMLRQDKAADDLAADLERALEAADAGDLLEHDEVMNMVRERFRGRVSPEIQREL